MPLNTVPIRIGWINVTSWLNNKSNSLLNTIKWCPVSFRTWDQKPVSVKVLSFNSCTLSHESCRPLWPLGSFNFAEKTCYYKLIEHCGPVIKVRWSPPTIGDPCPLPSALLTSSHQTCTIPLRILDNPLLAAPSLSSWLLKPFSILICWMLNYSAD